MKTASLTSLKLIQSLFPLLVTSASKGLGCTLIATSIHNLPEFTSFSTDTTKCVLRMSRFICGCLGIVSKKPQSWHLSLMEHCRVQKTDSSQALNWSPPLWPRTAPSRRTCPCYLCHLWSLKVRCHPYAKKYFLSSTGKKWPIKAGWLLQLWGPACLSAPSSLGN